MNTGNSITIPQLLDLARTQNGLRNDYRATTDNLYVDEDGRLDVRGNYSIVNGSDPAPLNLTKHALGQVAGRLGIAYGRAFLGNNETLPSPIVADILNHFLDENEGKEFLVRQFGDHVRGVLSNKYLIMDHQWVLTQALQTMTNPDTGEVAPHIVAPGWRLEPDYMQASIILQSYTPDNGSDGPYGLGASIRNGTVGNASTGVASIIMRTSCTNSIRERRNDWTVRHVGSTEILALRETLIIAAFAEAFAYSTELVDAMIRSRRQRLPNVFDVIGQMVQGQKLPSGIEQLVVSGTEQQESLFGLVNGITYAAHKGQADEVIDADTSEDLEALGGLLLTKYAEARALFSEARTMAHVTVGRDE
jgi:hypothetical protein